MIALTIYPFCVGETDHLEESSRSRLQPHILRLDPSFLTEWRPRWQDERAERLNVGTKIE